MDGFNRQALRVAVAQICQSMGWDAVQKSTHDTLTDVLQRYLEEIGKVAYGYTQICNRTNPNLDDLHLAFQDTGVVLNELENYVAQVDPVQFIHHFTSYPRCKPCRLQHPGSSEEIVDRAEFYSEHLPPLPKVSHEEPKDEKQEIPADENAKVLNAEACEKMKTNPLKEINQILEKSDSMPVKRHIESVADRDNKRPRLDNLVNLNLEKKENVENTDGESLSPATPVSPYLPQEIPKSPEEVNNSSNVPKTKTGLKAPSSLTKGMVLPLKKLTPPEKKIKLETSPSTQKKPKIKAEKTGSPKVPKKSSSPIRGSPTLGRGSPTLGRGSPTLGRGSPTMGRGSPTVGRGSPTLGRGSPTFGRGSTTFGRGSPSMGRGSPTMGRGSPTMGRGSPTMGRGFPTVGRGSPTKGRLSPLPVQKQVKTEKTPKVASPLKNQSPLLQKAPIGEKPLQHIKKDAGKASNEKDTLKLTHEREASVKLSQKQQSPLLSPVRPSLLKEHPTVNVPLKKDDGSPTKHPVDKPLKKKKSKVVDEADALKPPKSPVSDVLSKPKLMIKLLPKGEVGGATSSGTSQYTELNTRSTPVREVKTPSKSEHKQKVKTKVHKSSNESVDKVKSVDKIKISAALVEPMLKKEHNKKKKKKKDKDKEKEKRKQFKVGKVEEPIPKIRFKFDGSGDSKVVETKPAHTSKVISSSSSSKKSSVVTETEKVSRSIFTETLSNNTLDYDPNKAYFCPVCKKQDDGSPMVGCDGCDEWCHWPCVGLIAAPPEDEEWHCPQCLLKREKNKKSKVKKKH